MTHHAHSQAELMEYESAEHEFEDLVRQMEHIKYDMTVDDATKEALAERIVQARARFEDLSHSVTGVVGPESAPSVENNSD